MLFLEDNAARVRAFRAALAREVPDVDIMVWPDAHSMIREVGEHMATARLISLDHDLYAPAGAPDPGDGVDVARFLVSLPGARPPVIIHSSNADRSQWMLGEFELAGWPCTRVLPFGDAWVDQDWLPTALRLLRGGRRE